MPLISDRPSSNNRKLLQLSLLVLFLISCPAFAAAVDGAQALARDHGCLACHGMLRKQVGPGFAQIADRYRNDAAAPSRLAGKIQGGSVGTWGRVIMPRQSHVTDEEAKALAGWVLSQPPP
ncbi:c-type cytochrome [Variovorax paradoxus]|uniref:Cytochrome c-552 n=1 Tax=Variovorax paradoxus TaxID=34073 RepID=A0A0H2LV36_VARPD|nr:c-type cytochrome [Variovorax paradoxus]KLN54059.1 cytochrome c-552 precursor [Variovorax paradoxus]